MLRTAQERATACLDAHRELRKRHHQAQAQLIRRPGWLQLVTPGGGEWHNEVIASPLEEHQVAEAIRATIAHYHARELPCSWWVGPRTMPRRFPEHLAAHGFTAEAFRGLACSPSLPVEAPEVEILTAVDGNVVRLRAMHRGLEIGNASAVDVAGGKVAYLTGGWVAESQRGTGIDRALVRWRLVHARARGVELVMTQAVAGTSAPILARLGFETLFDAARHRLEPPARSAGKRAPRGRGR